MGVYIKGMEMPETCTDCFACHVFEDELYCEPLDTYLEPGSFGRLANCPLVPVPPHGRLIDADFAKNNMHTEHPYVQNAIRSTIKAAPTIIEEEEGA